MKSNRNIRIVCGLLAVTMVASAHGAGPTAGAPTNNIMGIAPEGVKVPVDFLSRCAS